MKKILLTGFLSLGIWLLASPEAMAVHKGSGDLTCGTCHTMHNSQGGSSLGGNAGGSLVLLRGAVTDRAEIHNFCLQCHSNDGAQATGTFSPHGNSAPKVLLSSATANKWDQDTLLHKIGGGGDFQYEMGDVSGGIWDATLQDGGVALGRGHSLGRTNVTPPGSTDGVIPQFTCTSCHDPHGTSDAASATINKFRNLRRTPTNSGTDDVQLTTTDHTSWVGGITGLFSGSGNYIPVNQATGAPDAAVTTTAIWPVFRGATPTAVAGDSNSYGGGTGGISQWCANCHDDWHETKQANNIAGGQNAKGDWRRHPVDNILDEGNCVSPFDQSGCSGAGVDILDLANYTPATAGTVLPVARATANTRVFYTTAVDATSDRVMCLSCHFAHGGPYYDNLRWDYLSSVGPAGSQVGNGVPTGAGTARGCQVCHNR